MGDKGMRGAEVAAVQKSCSQWASASPPWQPQTERGQPTARAEHQEGLAGRGHSTLACRGTRGRCRFRDGQRPPRRRWHLVERSAGRAWPLAGRAQAGERDGCTVPCPGAVPQCPPWAPAVSDWQRSKEEVASKGGLRQTLGSLPETPGGLWPRGPGNLCVLAFPRYTRSWGRGPSTGKPPGPAPPAVPCLGRTHWVGRKCSKSSRPPTPDVSTIRFHNQPGSCPSRGGSMQPSVF